MTVSKFRRIILINVSFIIGDNNTIIRSFLFSLQNEFVQKVGLI